MGLFRVWRLKIEKSLIIKKYSNELGSIKKFISNYYDKHLEDSYILDTIIEVVNGGSISTKDSDLINLLNIFIKNDLSTLNMVSEIIKPISFTPTIEAAKHIDKNAVKLGILGIDNILNEDALKRLDANIFSMLMGKEISFFLEELRDPEYILVYLRSKKDSGLPKKLKEYTKCYIKIEDPFVSVYSFDTLSEILTTRIDLVEIKNVE